MAGMLRRSPRVNFLTEFWPGALRRAGTDPVEFLRRVRELGFRVRVLQESSGECVETSYDRVPALAQTEPGGSTTLWLSR